MVKVRLSKQGSKKNTFYRIVAMEEGRARGGKTLDTLGYWYPKKKSVSIDKKKLAHWVSLGAQTTKALEKLIKDTKYERTS